MARETAKVGTRRPARGTIEPIERSGAARRPIPRPPGALDDLAVFVSVAEHASFAEASRRLNVPTSSVSRAVARLEESLGVSLLRRTSRAVTLTDEGKDLLARAASHLEGLDEALLAAADRKAEPSGVVRVTAPAFTGSTRVARALGAFARENPKVRIELDATNVIRDLLGDGFDLAIRVTPSLSPDFVARRLWRGHFGLFATRGFVDAALDGSTRVTREVLTRIPAVVLRADTVWRFRAPSGERVELRPSARFAVNDPRGAIDVARQGLGVVLAPLDAVPKSEPDLVPLEPDFGEPEPLDLHVVYPTRRLLPRRVRAVIAWLVEKG